MCADESEHARDLHVVGDLDEWSPRDRRQHLGVARELRIAPESRLRVRIDRGGEAHVETALADRFLEQAPTDTHLDARLLSHLTHDGLLRRLAVLDAAAGQGPIGAPVVLVPHHEDRAVANDRGAHANDGAVCGQDHEGTRRTC